MASYPCIRGLGGLLTIWNDDVLEKMEVVEGEFVLAVAFKIRLSNQQWVHLNVYGPVLH